MPVTKPKDIHSRVPGQRWLRERASMLRLYVHCLSVFFFRISFFISALFIYAYCSRNTTWA